jgi:hypothetical protein
MEWFAEGTPKDNIAIKRTIAIKTVVIKMARIN